MSWRDFTFAQPWWLLLLLALPLLAWLQGGSQPAPVVRFSSLSALRKVARPQRAGWGGFDRLLLCTALALLIIAVARPRLGKTSEIIESSGVDIMLALDISGSMAGEDYTIGGQPASRLDAVKDVTKRFIEARSNDRIGVTVFAGQPFLMSPTTLDHAWLLQNLERLSLNLVRSNGTAIGYAIASATNRLKDKVAKSKIIILLTDGKDEPPIGIPPLKPLLAAEAAKALHLKIYTIAVGTNGPVRVPEMAFGQKVYTTRRFPTDEPSLQEIARIADGQFFRAADTDSLGKVFEQIDKLEKTEIKLKQHIEWRELFEWFLAAGTTLLTLRLLLAHTLWRTVP